jgi:hypothetical protein
MKLSPVVRLDMSGWTANKKKTNCSLETMSIVDLTPVDLSLCAQAPCYEFAAVATLNLLGFPPQSHMYFNLNLALRISRSVSLDPRAQECANHPQPGIVASQGLSSCPRAGQRSPCAKHPEWMCL